MEGSLEKKYCIIHVDRLSRSHVAEIKKRNEHVNRADSAVNVNPDLSSLNRVVIGEANADWWDLFQQAYRESEHCQVHGCHKLYSNAVIGFEIICSMSRDAYERIKENPEIIDQWIETNTEFIKERFGGANGENVPYLCGSAHFDEAGSIHIHYFVTALKDNRFLASVVLNGKRDYRNLQDDYAKAMQPLGLRRGLRDARLPYDDIKKLYAKTSEMVQELPMPEPKESAKDYRLRISDLYRTTLYHAAQLENTARSHAYTRIHAENLEDENSELRRDILALKERKIGNRQLEDLLLALDIYPDRQEVLTLIQILEEWAGYGSEYRQLLNPELCEQASEEQDGTEDIVE